MNPLASSSSLPLLFLLLLLLNIVHPPGVWGEAVSEDSEAASRILQQAIELSKHFMDSPPVNSSRKHTVYRNMEKKVATQTTATTKSTTATTATTSNIKPRASNNNNNNINNRTGGTNDVNAERRMLNHEVRVVQGRCDINKLCPPDQYCDGIFCFIYKKEGDNCDLNGECERGSECQFGVCAKGVSPGDPGTFCDLARDCSGENQCCIRELSISHHTSICKPLLQMHESCGPINLFHQAEMKAHVEPLCGPCERGLACKGIGIFGRHSICLPNDEE